jgi:C1A family cysteine protease
MEGAYKLKSGTLESFAEQQLVDCVKTCYGCNGGWQSRAFAYYESHYAMTENSYTYTATDGTCAYTQNTYVRSTGTTHVVASSVADMMNAVAFQPVSVSIEADKLCFQMYKSVVLNNTKCGTTLDHAVLSVGYGTDPVGGDYWLLKNSWGSSWGEEGYIRIARVEGDGICGIQMSPPFTLQFDINSYELD